MNKAASPKLQRWTILLAAGVFCLSLPAFVIAQRQGEFCYPGPGENWERRTPQQIGMDSGRLNEAIEFARANESKTPRNLETAHYQSFGREPHGEGVGPFKLRGDQTGVILRHGYIVAEWGEPQRIDMTFSVTKSCLSTTVGLSYDRKLLTSLQDRVNDYTTPVVTLTGDFEKGRGGESALRQAFETEHNRKITWEHLLRQTSDWEGTLWGKPDWADRP